MINVALVTPNPVAAHAIGQMMEEMGLFRITASISPQESVIETIRLLTTSPPQLILLDLGNWTEAEGWLAYARRGDINAPVVGFRPSWTGEEQAQFEEAGIREVVQEPFSALELETAVYQALHREFPVNNPNLLIFMPAKAGSGASTVALHVAAELVHEQKKRVLLIEADRRSGVLSILLDLESRSSLDDALHAATTLSPVAWTQYYEDLGIHLLLANPPKRGPLPTWAHYFHLLRFVNSRYDYIVVDMPEVVNQATAELVRAANGVYLVCTPEVPSLKMAELRRKELAECEIRKEQIQIVLNRWQKNDVFTMAAVEKTLGQPVFSTLANDYGAVRDSITESRVVSSDSHFARDCGALARKLIGAPPPVGGRSAFDLIRRLGRMSAQ